MFSSRNDNHYIMITLCRSCIYIMYIPNNIKIDSVLCNIILVKSLYHFNMYLVAADCMPTAEAKVHPQHASSCVLRQRPRHAEQDSNDERMSLASLGNRESSAVAAGRPAASLAIARSTMIILLAIVEHGMD